MYRPSPYYYYPKLFTAAAYQITLGYFTGWLSLPFTLTLSMFSAFARMEGSDGSCNGNTIESEYLQKTMGYKNRAQREVVWGAVMSLWQEALRPVTYSLITLAAILDVIGYALKGIVNSIAPHRYRLDHIGGITNPHPFILSTAIRDIFWTAGLIAPSCGAMLAIRDESILGWSKKRLEKLDR